MKVSIITTIYKAEKGLPMLLDSMMAQKSSELEFFLIDNGSPDRCGDICREYAEKDSRFVVYTIPKNIGYIAARNLGLSIVDGDYVGFCDSDDYLESGAYDHALQILKQHHCDLYMTSWKTIYESSIVINKLPYEKGLYKGSQIAVDILPNAFGPINGRGFFHGFVWKQIYRNEIARKYSFIEELKPYEDQIFNINVIRECSSIYVDDTPLYNYIVNAESITAKLMADFDIHGEWSRLKLLYNEKKKRCNMAIEIEALSNSILLGIYALLLNEVNFTGSLRSFKPIIKSNRDFVVVICETSSANQSILLSIVRYCLKRNWIEILLFIIKGCITMRKKWPKDNL